MKLIPVLILFVATQASAKLSLGKMTADLKKAEEISKLYKSSQDLQKSPAAQVAPLLKANEKALDRLEKEFQSSSNFVRGEIEDEKTLNRLMTYLQLAMLRVRSASFKSQWPQVQNEFSSWFLFAADFPYEESSLIGLRTSGVLRSLLLDEMERIQQKFSKELAKDPQFRQWFSQIRAPWPVDRVLLSEAKRLLPPPLQPVANAAALAFQRNPYQTSAQALAKVKGGQSQGAELLKGIWRESDIGLMKTEMNRIGKLKLRLAQADFEFQNKKPAQSVQELLNAHLLDQAPIDYFTGKPLDLTSL